MQVPNWYQSAERREKFNYLIQLVAMHATPKCELGALANELGTTAATISLWKQAGRVPTVRAAMAIENMVGRNVVTWESLLNPESAVSQK